jgi:DNA mismatch endonuclease (patch repair protein)
MDTVDAATRSRIMRAVPRRDTSTELKLRRALHRLGLRYRLHIRELAGSPDIVFIKPRLAVFVHGCYWHRHVGCRLATTPKSNAGFWMSKFIANVARDHRASASLKADGWEVVTVWQCEVDGSAELIAERIATTVSNRLRDRATNQPRREVSCVLGQQ